MAEELTNTRGREASGQALMALAMRRVVSTLDRLISALMAADHLSSHHDDLSVSIMRLSTYRVAIGSPARLITASQPQISLSQFSGATN